MISSNCYSSVYPFPIDLNEDDQHQQHQLFNLKPQPLPLSSSSSSTSSHLTCPLFFKTSVQDQAPYDHQTQSHHFQQDDHQDKKYVSQDESFESDSGLKLCIWKTEGERNYESHHQSENSSAKWMPSKMNMVSRDHVDVLNNSVRRLEDQKKQQPLSSPDNSCNSSYNNNTIRVCSDCNTTKTPLWRSGPRGPKSLCNACGIRQRKARRAMAAAAGSVVHTDTKPNTKKKVQAKRSSNGCDSAAITQWKNKKRKLISSQGQDQKKKKLCMEELRIILSMHSAFHRVFPQDEKEAAILLMALSYGLVHG